MKIKMLVHNLDLTYGKTYDVYEIDSDGDLVVIDDIGDPNCVGKEEGVNFEVVEEGKPMNKITEDCYVNVAGWTEEEVQKAAEMFAEQLDKGVGDLEVIEEEGYIYLAAGPRRDVWVRSMISKSHRTELTKEDLFGVAMEPTNDFQRAWESVWDTICNHAPKDLFNQITQDGSGIENAVELIKVLSKHYKEPIKSASTVQHLQTFTMNHKNIEISFEDGKIAAKDWRGNGEPVEYAFDMIEQLEEFMNAWEVIGEYRGGIKQ